MACKRAAQSGTSRVIGPTWSSELANATTPNRDTRPYVGLRPTVPVSAAGWRMDPPVSVPSAPKTIRAATAAAEPPELPPGLSSRFHGFRVGK